MVECIPSDDANVAAERLRLVQWYAEEADDLGRWYRWALVNEEWLMID